MSWLRKLLRKKEQGKVHRRCFKGFKQRSRSKKQVLKVTKSLGGQKHLYSIYKKMQHRSIDYEQVYDVLAFRVLTEKLPECYEVLGLVHSLWKPLPGVLKILSPCLR